MRSSWQKRPGRQRRGLRTGESLGQKVTRVHIFRAKMLLDITDARATRSNYRAKSLIKKSHQLLLIIKNNSRSRRTANMIRSFGVCSEMPKSSSKWHYSGIYNDDNGVCDQWDNTSNYKHAISWRNNEDHVRQLTCTMSFVHQIIGKCMGHWQRGWGQNRISDKTKTG